MFGHTAPMLTHDGIYRGSIVGRHPPHGRQHLFIDTQRDVFHTTQYMCDCVELQFS
jgi:hypothetical protein